MFNQVFAQEIWRESFVVAEKGIWGSGDGTIVSRLFRKFQNGR
jgi:hypothetical protein